MLYLFSKPQNIFFALLISCLFFSCFKNKNEADKYNLKDDRTINQKLSFVSSFEHEEGLVIRLFRNKDHVLVSSAPDMLVYEYDTQGKLIHTYGKKGEGPEENMSVHNFDIDSNTYWLHNSEKKQLKKGSILGDKASINKNIKTKGEIAHWHGNLHIGLYCHPGKKIPTYFGVYDFEKDQVIRRFPIDSLIQEKPLAIFEGQDFYYAGTFSKNTNGDLLYSPNWVGYSFVFKTSGEVVVIKDFRELPYPALSLESNMFKLTPEIFTARSSCFGEPNEVMILANKNIFERRDDIFFVDIYNVQTGKYLRSISCPLSKDNERPLFISYRNQQLCVNYVDGTIAFYNIQKI